MSMKIFMYLYMDGKSCSRVHRQSRARQVITRRVIISRASSTAKNVSDIQKQVTWASKKIYLGDQNNCRPFA